MPVGIAEIRNDVTGGLIDVPIKPRCCRNNTAIRPATVIGKLVCIVNMDIGRLGSHGLQFSVILDGQQPLGIPEPFVVGIEGCDGGGRRDDEGANDQLSTLGDREACAPSLDQQTSAYEIDTNPHQDACHHPRYRIEHIRYPRFSDTAQEVTVGIQFTEV